MAASVLNLSSEAASQIIVILVSPFNRYTLTKNYISDQ